MLRDSEIAEALKQAVAGLDPPAAAVVGSVRQRGHRIDVRRKVSIGAIALFLLVGSAVGSVTLLTGSSDPRSFVGPGPTKGSLPDTSAEARVRGRITNPPAGKQIIMWSCGVGGDSMSKWDVDAQGRFDIAFAGNRPMRLLATAVNGPLSIDPLSAASDLAGGGIRLDADVPQRVDLTLKDSGGKLKPLLDIFAGACRAGSVPGDASVAGTVTNEQGQPIEDARVEFVEFGVSMITGNDGRFSVGGLPIRGDCDLIDIAVKAPEFGLWRSLDNPLYSDSSHDLEVHLNAKPQTDRVGPPLVDPHACERGD